MADMVISSLRGGLNNTDPAIALELDRCTVAENVEFYKSMLGEKRRGCTNVTLPTLAAGLKCVPFMFRHVPNIDESTAELWALFTPTDEVTQSYSLQRKTTAWAAVTVTSAAGDIDVTSSRMHHVHAVSLHSKLFLAYVSVGGIDRLKVYDGTSVRPVGLTAPVAAPGVADTGGGTFSGKRYYRTRFTVQSAGVTIRRSEPSAVTTFTPSGAGLSARVTKPAATSPTESETHWEVEASINNADFYRIATVVVGTATYDDSIAAYTVGYAASGTLSETIGDYALPWSARYLAADEDRLVFAGSLSSTTNNSRVGWTPVSGSLGVGNDERIPTQTTNYLDLDTGNGGEITGISRSINGSMFVFKIGRIYKLTRTDNINKAYSSICITTSRGAMHNSVVEGLDEQGRPCLYFCDPRVGPCRLGASGLQMCGLDILNTWNTVNVDAFLPVFGTFYPKKHQLHYWIATNGGQVPNMRIVAQVNNMRSMDDGVRRGWSTWSSGRSCTSVYTACIFASNIESNTTRSVDLVPFVGTNDTVDSNIIQQCDAANATDGGTYTASVRSRPYTPGNLINKFGVMAGAMLLTTATGVQVSCRLSRDFGVETKTVTGIDCTLTSTETASGGSPTQVVRYLDNMFNSECRALQVEFGDLSGVSGLWEVNMIAFAETPQDAVSGS